MIILPPRMNPVTGLFNVAPPSQLCGLCPASWVTSESESEVWSTSGQMKSGGGVGLATGVHARAPPPSARSKFDLTTCGATYGSGCHEFAIIGWETGAQGPKLLVVTKPSLKMYVIFALHKSSLEIV